MAAPTLLGQMWNALDAVVDRMMADEQDPDGRDPGRAEGIGLCIAIVVTPYGPDLDAVREEAMVRWQKRQEEE